jgi:hypothetical protein
MAVVRAKRAAATFYEIEGIFDPGKHEESVAVPLAGGSYHVPLDTWISKDPDAIVQESLQGPFLIL